MILIELMLSACKREEHRHAAYKLHNGVMTPSCPFGGVPFEIMKGQSCRDICQ